MPVKLQITDAAGVTATLTAPLTIDEYVPSTIFGGDRSPIDTAVYAPGYTRIYGPNGMPTAAKLNGLPAGTVLVGVSYKGATNMAAVTAAIKGVKLNAGRLYVFESIHEMDRSVDNGGPAPADYHANYQPLSDTVRGLDPDGTHFGLTQTFMRYSQAHNRPARSWEQFYRPEVDFVGVDIEWDAAFGATSYPDPAKLLAIPLDIKRQTGKRLLLPELAWRQLAYDTSGVDLAKWYTDMAQACRDTGVYAAAFYDTDGSTGKYRLADGSPALAAVKKIIG
jgi:hypothetical protein